MRDRTGDRSSPSYVPACAHLSPLPLGAPSAVGRVSGGEVLRRDGVQCAASRSPRCPSNGPCPRPGPSRPSMSIALRSGIFVSAICRTWSLVTEPTFSAGRLRRPSRARPPAAAGTASGGVLVMNVNDRSSKIEISAGITMPRWFSVCGVVRLAEVHDVDAVRAERGADRRRGRRLAGRDLDLDDRGQASSSPSLFSVPQFLLARASRPGRTRARPGSPGRRC